MEEKNETKKFYWLKLKRDFFKRHDVIIIESMPNGKDYLLFYLKLLCESVDHQGNLRFSDEIPYNEQMLSTITNTNIDIVRSAIQVFTKLNMMELLDDGTFYMNKVNEMIGSAVDNDNANRQRRFREKQKQLALQERYDSVTKNNESIDIDKDIDIDKELYKNNKEINKENSSLVDTQLVEKTKKQELLDEIESMFNQFWKAYPKKVDKQGCLKKFKKIPKIKDIFNDLMLALENQKNSAQWQDTQYIPHPATWINQRRWENEVDENNNKNTQNNIWNSIDMKDW